MRAPKSSLTSPVAEERHAALLAVLDSPNAHRRSAAAISECLADRDPANAFLAVQALHALGAAGLSPLHASLRRMLPGDRVVAILTVLGTFGPRARGGVADILPRLRDPHPRIRWHAALTLSHVGRDALPAICERLESGRADEAETIALCDAARRIGDAPRSTLECVHARAREASEELASSTCALLHRHAFREKEARRRLEDLLQSGDTERLRTTLQRLGENRGTSLPLEPSIRAVLTRDEPVPVRALAALTLGRIGAREERSLEALRLALRDTHPEVRYHALLAIDLVVAEDGEFSAAVQPLRSDADESVRAALAGLIARRS